MMYAISLENDSIATSSDEFKWNILYGSAVNTVEQMSINYLYPGSEHGKLTFLKIEGGSIAVDIEESHSV